jgi:hypothetical protein
LTRCFAVRRRPAPVFAKASTWHEARDERAEAAEV